MPVMRYERTSRGAIVRPAIPTQEESKQAWREEAAGFSEKQRERFLALEDALRDLEVEQGLPRYSMSARTFPGIWQPTGASMPNAEPGDGATEAAAPAYDRWLSKCERDVLAPHLPLAIKGSNSRDWCEHIDWFLWRQRTGAMWSRVPNESRMRKAHDDFARTGGFDRLRKVLPKLLISDSLRADLDQLCAEGGARGMLLRERFEAKALEAAKTKRKV